MTAITNSTTFEDSLAELQTRAQTAALNMQGPHLNAIADYIEALISHELIRCATFDDDTHLRRSQGCVSAYSAVHSLLQYQPIEKRRSVSRREV